MELPLTITELAKMTNKSRPSLYKYLSAYEEGRYDDLPRRFFLLFKKLGDPRCSRAAAIRECEALFASRPRSEEAQAVYDYLSAHEADIDFAALLSALKENLYA